MIMLLLILSLNYEIVQTKPTGYDRCGWRSCPKHKFWRDFAYDLIDDDEKVASSKQHTQFKTRAQKSYPI